ncbi:MAG: hypothetical protein BroJett022_18990 [Actinomycetes bacterium]|nr:MAG: hypothetical protein BroJett022_18990 [Actinomycetes bacterium]
MRTAAGTEPVRIDDLISPLRYDVLVRRRFLDRIAAASGPADVDAAVASPAGRDYRSWFEGIVIRRFHPELAGTADAVERAFAERVRRSVALCESFAAAGYDPAGPLLLRSGRRIAATATGKRIERRLFVGDGCHRLALLRRDGATALQPDAYRVEITPTLAPLDNTAELIPLLGLRPRPYFRFLALAYAPGTGCDTEERLRRHVAAERPDRLLELESVLRIDLPLLDAVP